MADDVKPIATVERLLVAGRVGELAEITSPLSFSLIEKIFGYKGPYRDVLSSFKVPIRDIPESYLVNVRGRIYGDIKIENEVFWKHYPYELFLRNGSVVPALKVFKSSLPVCIVNLIKKTYFESNLLSDSSRLQHEIDLEYRGYSIIVKACFEKKSLSVDAFLDAYKLVIHVSYLYDLLYKIYGNNLEKFKETKQELIGNYITHNDFLVSGDTSSDYVELKLKADNDFELAQPRPIEGDAGIFEGCKFIPDALEDLEIEDKAVAILVKAQCARDNMRLKTGVLLYILRLNLFEKVKRFGLEDSFAYLTVDEVEGLSLSGPNIVDGLVKLANRRKTEFNPELAKKLPKILIGDRDSKNYKNFEDWGGLERPKESYSQNVFKGIPCSKGVISGSVQYIENPKDDVTSPIVLFPNASPTFTHHFRKAKGLIFLVGSALSHGAIVAREMGVPAAVIDVELEDIKGREVELDGGKGTLKIL